MTAADYQALAADAATETASVKAATARIAFDYMAPLPDLHIRHGRSWEPAARRYRDIEPEEKELA
ncbi:hypothetical protein ACLKOZ_16890 [Arthrobacter sp. R4]|uniref:hypothetical protein n=1 Tax=Arthrobacter sp. R4 TaxID=644417 RepID=UPI003EDADFAE